MRKYHFLVVAALVGAIVACLMVRTPDATAQSETAPPAAPADAMDMPPLNGVESPTPAVENGPPPNDPVLNEELSKMQGKAASPAPTPEPAAPVDAPKSSGVMKQAFKQSPAPRHTPASVKKKPAGKSAKAKKSGSKDKKKKKKTKHS